jgi:hypothetical protein
MPSVTVLDQQPDLPMKPFDWLSILLSKEALRLILRLVGLVTKLVLHSQQSDRPYEALKLEFGLEIIDSQGREAIYTKNEVIRVLRDFDAISDETWYDGKALATQVSPGRVVDRRRVGSRLRSTVLLPKLRHRGEVIPLRIRRLLRNSFKRLGDCWLEAEVAHKVDFLSMTVLFPLARPVRHAEVVTELTQTPLGLPLDVIQDGRQQVIYSVDKPPIGKRYTLRWGW